MRIKPLYQKLSLAAFSLAGTTQQALSALPTVTPPSTGAAGTDYLGTFKGYIKDGSIIIGLILAVGALVWIAYHILQDLHEVRTGRKEMGNLVMSVIAGGGVLLMVMFLANQAATIIT
jgi:integrating conjugative element membrane protein (TIGR03745 family)